MIGRRAKVSFIAKKMAYQNANSQNKESFSEKNLDRLQESMIKTGEALGEVAKQAEETLGPIRPEYQKYLELSNRLKTQFDNSQQPVYEIMDFFGKQVSVVLEKRANNEGISAATYLNFVDLQQRGEEINFLDWAKKQTNPK